MSDERKTIPEQWKPYTSGGQLKQFPCCEIGCHGLADLLYRTIIGRDGEVHREYKIQCTCCTKVSGVHRSKDLTIAEWEAHCNLKNEPKLKYRTRHQEDEDEFGLFNGKTGSSAGQETKGD